MTSPLRGSPNTDYIFSGQTYNKETGMSPSSSPVKVAAGRLAPTASPTAVSGKTTLLDLGLLSSSPIKKSLMAGYKTKGQAQAVEKTEAKGTPTTDNSKNWNDFLMDD